MKIEKSVVTVGNFDGVHIGHREIFRHLIAEGRKRKLLSVAVTFDPHPALILGHAAPPLLSTPSDRIRQIEFLGIGHAMILRFTPQLAAMSARDFVEQILLRDLGMKFLLIGPNTHVGKGREGTPQRLRELSQQLSFDLEIVPEVEAGGEIVSSSRIRSLLTDGNVEEATTLLGRPYSTHGKVVKGASRGKGLGFPTANLEQVPTMLPKRGVYATRVTIGNQHYTGATNIGVRPTVDPVPKEIVETHILDFSENLVGIEIELEWIKRIRDEKKFLTAEELAAQINKDIQVARNLRNVP